jgi:hypothetical protein
MRFLRVCGMSDLVLSRSEMAELARSPRKASQIAFLQQNGILHYLDAHDWPVVLRSAVEATEPATATKPPWRPNKAA